MGADEEINTIIKAAAKFRWGGPDGKHFFRWRDGWHTLNKTFDEAFRPTRHMDGGCADTAQQELWQVWSSAARQHAQLGLFSVLRRPVVPGADDDAVCDAAAHHSAGHAARESDVQCNE